MDEDNFSWVGWIVIILIVWGISSLFSKKDDTPKTDVSNSSYTSPSYSSNEEEVDYSHCEEPYDPYDEGSGHYAGYEWGQENYVSYCDGNSDSFIEGCEEYLAQTEEYENCIAN